jgi:hypothetical protein
LSRNKEGKRAYGNFDKEVAHKMFGYRITFKEEKQVIPDPEDNAPQNHKPVYRFAAEIISELTSHYLPITSYGTKQRI